MTKLPDLEDSRPLSRGQEQGVLMDCIYCKILYPQTNSAECLHCQGKGQYFQPARMMSRELAWSIVVTELADFLHKWSSFLLSLPDQTEVIQDRKIMMRMRNNAFQLLKNVVIYDFDLKEFLIQLIRSLDEYVE